MGLFRASVSSLSFSFYLDLVWIWLRFALLTSFFLGLARWFKRFVSVALKNSVLGLALPLPGLAWSSRVALLPGAYFLRASASWLVVTQLVASLHRLGRFRFHCLGFVGASISGGNAWLLLMGRFLAALGVVSVLPVLRLSVGLFQTQLLVFCWFSGVRGVVHFSRCLRWVLRVKSGHRWIRYFPHIGAN